MRDVPLVGPIERALHLRSLSMFEELPPREIALISQLMKEEFVAAGTVIAQEGVPADKFALLVDGRVRNERKGRVLGTVKPPSLIGVSGILGGRVASVRSMAETNVTLLSIEAQEFLEVLEDRFEVFLHLRKFFATNVTRLQREVGIFHTPGVAQPQEVPAPERPLSIVEQLLFLRQASVFRGIPVNVLAHLIRGEPEIRANAGEKLWTDGDPGAVLLAIVSGRVRCGADGGRGAFVAGPRYVLGADAVLGGVPYCYEAVADTPLIAIGVQAAALTDLMEDHFELGRRSLEHFAREEIRLQEHASEPEREAQGRSRSNA